MGRRLIMESECGERLRNRLAVKREHAHTRTRMYARKHTNIHIHIHTRARTNTHIHALTHPHASTHRDTRKHTHTYNCIPTRTHSHIHTQHIYLSARASLNQGLQSNTRFSWENIDSKGTFFYFVGSNPQDC